MSGYEDDPSDDEWGGIATLHDTRPAARPEQDEWHGAAAHQEDLAAARRVLGEHVERPATANPLLARWQRFVQTYGWRAYALPILCLVTVFALLNTAGEKVEPIGSAPLPQPRAAVGAPVVDDAVPSAVPGPVNPTDLPAGGAFTEKGTGTFAVVPAARPPIGTGREFRYMVEVENGVTGVDKAALEASVHAALADRRSWAANGDARFIRVTSGPVDFRIALTSSLTVRDLCGYEIKVETSCWAMYPEPRVVLNVSRWVRGAVSFGTALDDYRRYMVNHEVGHAIGLGHETACTPSGLAPVMMQQTLGITADGGVACKPNPWPYPGG